MGPTELLSILSKAIRAVARKGRREGWSGDDEATYGLGLILRIYLICVFGGMSPRIFYQRLREWSGFRRQWSLPNQLICESQAKKRFRTAAFERGLVELLKLSGERALKAAGPDEVRVVSMDLTRIESDPDSDSYGAWGIDSGGLFWGYKLGLIISQHGVVLGMTLMKGNWTEFKVNRKLVKKARDVIQGSFGELPVEYLLCDAGFDGEKTYKAGHEKLGAKVLCPARRRRNPKRKRARETERRARRQTPHRYWSQQLWNRPDSREIFKKRGEIERVNGQLKDTGFRIQDVPPRQRGVRRLRLVVLAKLIIYNLALYVNIAKGRPARAIKAMVA